MRKSAILFAFIILLAACQSQKNEKQQKMDPQNKVTVQMFVGGMTCAGCEKTIVKSISELEGTIEAKASFESGTATIVFDESKIGIEELTAAITKKNYTIERYVIEESEVKF